MNKEKIINIVKNNKGTILMLIGIIAVKSSIVDWSFVPTGSLRPTLADGDQILINKVAYDLKIPLTQHSLVDISEPKNNDIVVFDKVVDGKEIRMVKRLIGIPKDHIQIKNNKLFVNGKEATYKDIKGSKDFTELDKDSLSAYKELGFKGDKIDVKYKTETLNGFTHKIRLETGAMSKLPPNIDLIIPENKYLMIGDNRNNSYDSRFWGLVDRKEIIGKATNIIFSLDKANGFIPRTDRFLIKIS